MGFAEAVRTCFRNYVTFSGRAARPEYWWFVLAVVVGSVVFGLLDGMLFGVEPVPTDAERDPPQAEGAGPLQGLWTLATLLPLIAVGWRRMHDIGKPGWYFLLPVLLQVTGTALLLIGLVSLGTPPEAGAQAGAAGMGLIMVLAALQLAVAILLIWWLTRPSEPGANAYGPPPTAGGAA